MKKSNRLVIFIAAALLLVIAAVLIYRQQQPRFNWYETYDIKSKEPYGAYVISEMLKGYNPEKKFKILNQSLEEFLKKDKSHDKANYVFIGSTLRFDSDEAVTLFSFVERGNAAFISSSYISYNLLSRLFPDTCVNVEEKYYSKYDSVQSFNFYHPSLNRTQDYKLTYVFRNQSYQYSWSYIDSNYFCGHNNSAVALGYISQGYINFIKKHYGKGDFYFHTSPLIFTNYSLMQEENIDYTSKVFSYLPKADIIWDDYNKLPGDLNFNNELSLSQSPLQFILSQESLRWAWYIVLVLLIFFMIFFGKRRQLIIPIFEARVNTSLEFINTIGQLYYHEQNHHVICKHKMKLFRSFLRQRYFINTKEVNEDTIKNISIKSQIPLEHIKNIFHQFNWIDRNLLISEDELIQFHQLVGNFYKNCK